MEKQIMLGNEAFARGAYEAGVHVISSYPGTPSKMCIRDRHISGFLRISGLKKKQSIQS